jgi:hypothetical protein
MEELVNKLILKLDIDDNNRLIDLKLPIRRNNNTNPDQIIIFDNQFINIDIRKCLEEFIKIFFYNLNSINHNILEIQTIYIYGSAAYDIYDKILSSSALLLNKYAPMYEDYDIMIHVLGNLDKALNNIINYIINQIYIFVVILRMNNLLNTLEDITDNNYIINKKIGLNVLKYKDDYILSINIKQHKLIDLIFTTKKSEIKIIFTYNNLLIPDIESLLKLSLKGIINRGLRVNKYKKSTNDYYRLNYIFQSLNHVFNKQIIMIGSTKNIINRLYNVFKYIYKIFVHCGFKDVNSSCKYINLINNSNILNQYLHDLIESDSVKSNIEKFINNL